PDSPYLFTQTFVNTMVRLSNLISLEAKVRLTLSEGTEVTEILSQDWGMPWTEKAKPQNLVSLKRYSAGTVCLRSDREAPGS
ncbi:hypothetical protein BGZ46_002278, partial [Entomortierella lignicola]